MGGGRGVGDTYTQLKWECLVFPLFVDGASLKRGVWSDTAADTSCVTQVVSPFVTVELHVSGKSDVMRDASRNTDTKQIK